jgi:hypothetical protein
MDDDFRCDVSEEASKAAKMRAEKAEEEVQELMNKARQLEIELGMCVRLSCSEHDIIKFSSVVLYVQC